MFPRHKAPQKLKAHFIITLEKRIREPALSLSDLTKNIENNS